MDKDKLIYDLSLICVKQCLLDTEPSDMETACEYSVKAFENAYKTLSTLIEPILASIDAH